MPKIKSEIYKQTITCINTIQQEANSANLNKAKKEFCIALEIPEILGLLRNRRDGGGARRGTDTWRAAAYGAGT